MSDEGDQLRAGAYALLARLLRQAPDDEVMVRLQHVVAEDDAQEGSIAHALGVLKLAAASSEPSQVEQEFTDLFIGLGRGELVPYGSWYLTGYLMEKPLSDLRNDLRDMGYERTGDTREPEDHIAALCEVMAMLIAAPGTAARQSRFFCDHMQPWIEQFFADLTTAQSACFYTSVGRFGAAFSRFEKQYLSLDE